MDSEPAAVKYSASFLAEISFRSPRKIIIFIIQEKKILDQSIRKLFYLKTEALVKYVSDMSNVFPIWPYSRQLFKHANFQTLPETE